MIHMAGVSSKTKQNEILLGHSKSSYLPKLLVQILLGLFHGFLYMFTSGSLSGRDNHQCFQISIALYFWTPAGHFWGLIHPNGFAVCCVSRPCLLQGQA